ncbi:unnamed protein product [Adineta ricciae]|uniref:BTB domain-containing protein n=1 Tax=Adineta ricciae TaxID=249248 RepID=A0A814CQ51_ADIRI|nr:unnamed protein product [Adineta ricciae]
MESATKKFTEQFFVQAHPFSDLTLFVQDRELYVDKSVLAVGSKVFRTYLQDTTIDSIEILDVSADDMIELLRFLYPQYHCTINNHNVTILLILANRFEIDFVTSACRTFILVYLSKLELSCANELIEQDDGTRLPISSILEILCIWFREFFYMNDTNTCRAVLDKLSQCKTSTIDASNGFKGIDEAIKWRIFQARAKHLEIKASLQCK